MEPDVSSITVDILSYLLDHPDAEDTIEGITEWWILEACIKRQTAEVQRTVDALVRDGWIDARHRNLAGVRYRLNPAKLPQIRDLVEADE